MKIRFLYQLYLIIILGHETLNAAGDSFFHKVERQDNSVEINQDDNQKKADNELSSEDKEVWAHWNDKSLVKQRCISNKLRDDSFHCRKLSKILFCTMFKPCKSDIAQMNQKIKEGEGIADESVRKLFALKNLCNSIGSLHSHAGQFWDLLYHTKAISSNLKLNSKIRTEESAFALEAIANIRKSRGIIENDYVEDESNEE